MYLLLERPGAPTQRIKIAGDVAVVGRSPQCDVVIDEEFVSKQHLRVLRGLVAVDLSTNGTFLEGERVTGGAVLDGKPLQIGRSDITIRVEEEDVTSAAAVSPAVLNARSRPPAAAPAGASSTDPEVLDPEATVVLRRELKTLAQQLAQKTTALAEATRQVEQAAAQAAALGGENEALRARIAQIGAESAVPEAPADASAASMLLFKLQRENAQLKKAIAELSTAAPPSPVTAAPPRPPAAAPSAPASSTDSVVPVARDAAPRGGTVLSRLAELVQQDAEAVATRLDDPLDAFLTTEGYRFLRRVERVITRLAGGLIQLYQLHTMVPGVEGNLRELLAAAMAQPDKESIREELLDYLKELGRWMVVALSAYRKAAEGFAVQLRDELTADALTASDPIPVMKRVSGKSEAELWHRACARLRDLSPDAISERLEKLARDSAQALADNDASQAFP